MAYATKLLAAAAGSTAGSFRDRLFREKVDRALDLVETILQDTRRFHHDDDDDDDTATTPPPSAQLLGDHHDHTWTDKFALAEVLTRSSIAAQLNVLERILRWSSTTHSNHYSNHRNQHNHNNNNNHNNNKKEYWTNAFDIIQREWVQEKKRSVVLRFTAKESCSFLREETVSHVAAEYETEETVVDLDGTSEGGFDKKKKTNTKLMAKSTIFHWEVNTTYQILACPGGDCQVMMEEEEEEKKKEKKKKKGYGYFDDDDDNDESWSSALRLVHRTRSTILQTKAPESPFATRSVTDPIDVNLSWLLQQVDVENSESSSGGGGGGIDDGDGVGKDAASSTTATTTTGAPRQRRSVGSGFSSGGGGGGSGSGKDMSMQASSNGTTTPALRLLNRTRSTMQQTNKAAAQNGSPPFGRGGGYDSDPIDDVNLSWIFQNAEASMAGGFGDSGRFEDAGTTSDGATMAQRLVQFTIDRRHKEEQEGGEDENSPRTTPTRNPEVSRALKFHADWYRWCDEVREYLSRRNDQITSVQQQRRPHSASTSLRGQDSITRDSIFVPIFPVLLKTTASSSTTMTENDDDDGGPILDQTTTQAFLNKQVKTMREAMKRIEDTIPPHPSAASDAAASTASLSSAATSRAILFEATLYLLAGHAMDCASMYIDSTRYMEETLRTQLAMAVGKVLTSRDFDDFMKFYGQKFFAPDFAPVPFSHAIGQPGRYPDGTLSLEDYKDEEEEEEKDFLDEEEDYYEDEEDYDVATVQPFYTLVRHIPARNVADGVGVGGEGPSGSTSMRPSPPPPPPISIPLGAAATVEMTGDRYLHGWMQHRFSSLSGSATRKTKGSVRLAARARQFSSFLLVVGNLQDSTTLIPKHAVILQNKDEVLIPLLTEPLPSAKEFRDAISTLSPQQQEFARAFRAMQLESTVFAVCVVQLKPQLERLLGLPDGALTKEMSLTQSLMSLFVDYQIPSDLLSYDGPEDVDAREKVEAVKGHVKTVLDVIQELKTQQLKEEKEKAEMRFETHRSSASPRRASRMGYASAEAFENLVEPHEYTLLSTSGGATRMSSYLGASSAMSGDDGNMKTRRPQHDSHKGDHFEHDDNNDDDDFTMIPKRLDAQLEKHDADGALRSTVIKADTTAAWVRTRHENLLSAGQTRRLSPEEINTEKRRAMDLLDAISRSGNLPLEAAELHIIVAVTHAFDKSVVDTLIQDNVNPIAKVERSLLLLVSAIHPGVPLNRLIGQGHILERLSHSFPPLFVDEDEDGLKFIKKGKEKEPSSLLYASEANDASKRKRF